MAKPNKKTAWLPNPALGKQSVVPESDGGKKSVQNVSWGNNNPAWRVRNLEMCDPFGWHRVRPHKQQEILKKLGEFESMTWAEILIVAKKQHHSIEITKICNEARVRLRQTPHKGARELLSLRLSGEERIWGYFDGKVMDLLWWDPRHEICPSALRNT